jgi:protein-disulfide isomerase
VQWSRSIVCSVAVVLGLGLPSVLAQPAPSERLAEVNGEAITAKEVEAALGAKLSKLQEQIYNLKRQELEALIAERLLAQEAARRGVTVSALVEAEVTAKTAAVTDKEVDAYYQANKNRLSGEEATVRQSVQERLQRQKVAARKAQLVDSLKSQGHVVVHLQRPPIARVAVSVDGAPVRGADGAVVTLVEFSDYHCPFCKRAQPTMKQLLERYPGKIRHVFRDFPIDSLHPQARGAAEAARCAQDQSKFWEYHELLFSNAPKSSPEDLRRYAQQAGLDVPTFERCVSAGTHRATVQRDVDEATRLGLNGTPAFFINGRPVHGAQPLDVFARVIEEELGRP